MPRSALPRLLAAGTAAMVAGAALRRLRRTPRELPPGRRKRPSTRALEAGARLLQPRGPLARFDVHLVGFHPMKHAPTQQVEAHHYCHQVNEDFMQCVVFDGSGPEARLTGVEYIISERLYETLAEEEKALWHPHNYEILSGLLTAPGLPAAAEKELMRRKVNSYGKTWHFWMTGGAGHESQPLPTGEPCLAWSFNHDGEAAPALLERHGHGALAERKRHEREELCALAHPQRGVDTLRPSFPASSGAPPGVREAD